MDNSLKADVNTMLKISKALLLLLTSLISFCILILGQFTDIFIEIELSPVLTLLSSTFLLISLILLLVKDFTPNYRVTAKEFITLVASISISIYIVLGSIIEVIRFRCCEYVYIPPMFIVLKYRLSTSSIVFKSLTLSIPLGVAFITFTYSLYELIKTVSAMRIKYLSKIVNRPNV